MIFILRTFMVFRPDLTWRDLQWLCVESGVLINPQDPDWRQNGARRFFSHKYGFGKLDAAVILEKARHWKLVNTQTRLIFNTKTVNKPIPSKSDNGLSTVITVPDNDETRQMRHIEQVTVTVNLFHPFRGCLEIDLISPSGMVSELATRRRFDYGTRLDQWTFMTVANWGERPQGNWTLRVRNRIDSRQGHFYSWSMGIYGEKDRAPIPIPIPIPIPPNVSNQSSSTTEDIDNSTSTIQPLPAPSDSKSQDDDDTDDDTPPPTPIGPLPDTLPDTLPTIGTIDANPTLSYLKGTFENLALITAAIGGVGMVLILCMVTGFLFFSRPRTSRTTFRRPSQYTPITD
jgi:kexin